MRTSISNADISSDGVLSSSAETPTGQSRLAYRLAAITLFANVLTTVIDALIAKSSNGIAPIVIDLALAIGLLQFRRGARQWVLIRAVLGAILWPIISFLGNGPLTAAAMTAMQWGFSGALILLLTGESKTWRLALGIGLYLVFTVMLFGLFVLLATLVS